MEISPAVAEDAEEILALQRLAYQSEAAIYDDFTIPPLTETLDDLKARFRDRQFLKAIEDGRIIGSVRAFQDNATCHVERLIVHPGHRCRGIGSGLLSRIETLFPAARRFQLFTGHKSAGNIRLYERIGYRAFRREPVNEKVTLVYMEKGFLKKGCHRGVFLRAAEARSLEWASSVRKRLPGYGTSRARPWCSTLGSGVTFPRTSSRTRSSS